MTTRVNDLSKVETNFYRNLGDGRKAAKFFGTLVHSVVSSRDTTVFTRQMDKIRKEKSDLGAIRAMFTIIKAVWPGAKGSYSKAKGGHTIVIKGVKADKAALTRMDDALKDNLSLRDTFAQRVRGDVEPPVVDKSKAPEAAKKLMAKFCDKYDCTPVAFMAMLTAKNTDTKKLSETPSAAVVERTTTRASDAAVTH